MRAKQYKKNVLILKEYEFLEDKSIGVWINYRDLKIFHKNCLFDMKEADLTQKLYFKNQTGKWIVYISHDILFLNNNDIEFMFGTNKMK